MNTHVSLSLELICLVNWLLKNEKNLINTLVKQAFKNGFAHELEKIDNLDLAEDSDQLHATILDFLLFLEHNLVKNLETIDLDPKTKNIIVPVLKKLDADNLDLKTLWLSMQQTKEQLNRDQHVKQLTAEQHEVTENAESILFERILKNWKPNQQDPIH